MYVAIYVKSHTSAAINKLIAIIQVTDNNNTSSFVIKDTDSNATLDNGIYRCEVTLTISGVNSFSKTSQMSIVLFKGMATVILYHFINMYE